MQIFHIKNQLSPYHDDEEADGETHFFRDDDDDHDEGGYDGHGNHHYGGGGGYRHHPKGGGDGNFDFFLKKIDWFDLNWCDFLRFFTSPEKFFKCHFLCFLLP